MIFADIDLATINIDPAAVEAAVSRATVALLPVHYAGRPAAMAALTALAARRGLHVVEDAAHAFGAAVGGRRVGADQPGRDGDGRVAGKNS